MPVAIVAGIGRAARDELEQGAALGLDQGVVDGCCDAAFRIADVCLQRLLDALQEARGLAEHEGFSKAGLVTELLVERRSRHPGTMRHLSHAHPVPAAVDDQVVGSLEDSGAHVLPEPFAHGRCPHDRKVSDSCLAIDSRH